MMANEKAKEPEVTKTASAQEELKEPRGQTQTAETGAAPEGGEKSGGQTEGTAAGLGENEKTPAPVDGQPSNAVDQAEKTGPQEPTGIDPTQITDSTSIVEVTKIVAEDEGEQLGDPNLHNEMERFNVGTYPDGIDTVEKQREYGKNLCLRYNIQLNKANTLIEAKKVDYFITLGDGCRRQKKLVQDSGLQWLEWVIANWPGISLRSIQKYMQLSRRTDAHAHKSLGFERLSHVMAVTEDDDVDDPITELFVRFGIDTERTSDETVQEFKTKVDAAVLVKRLAKSGIPAEYDQMLRFVRNGYSLSARMISELKVIKDDRTRVRAYIESVMANLGKSPEPMEITEVNHFNSAAKKMTGTIESILEKPALARQVSLDEINALEAKVAELKRLISGA
jgi:hypothetical protein